MPALRRRAGPIPATQARGVRSAEFIPLFFFSDPATTVIYALSLHAALLILALQPGRLFPDCCYNCNTEPYVPFDGPSPSDSPVRAGPGTPAQLRRVNFPGHGQTRARRGTGDDAGASSPCRADSSNAGSRRPERGIHSAVFF